MVQFSQGFFHTKKRIMLKLTKLPASLRAAESTGSKAHTGLPHLPRVSSRNIIGKDAGYQHFALSCWAREKKYNLHARHTWQTKLFYMCHALWMHKFVQMVYLTADHLAVHVNVPVPEAPSL